MPFDRQTLTDVEEQLQIATRDRQPIGQISAAYPEMDAADAYQAQQVQVGSRISAGESIVGWRVGLTSAAMQQQLGVDQPDYGPVLRLAPARRRGHFSVDADHSTCRG
jgi:2-keto-4-pentenoate hydratase